MSDDVVATYFDFRFRLAFSALGARHFFGHRYWNADNVRLVVHAFTPEGAGGAMVTTRRRDGHTNNYISKSAFTEARPPLRAIRPTVEDLAFVRKQIPSIGDKEPEKARDMLTFLDEWSE